MEHDSSDPIAGSIGYVLGALAVVLFFVWVLS